MLKRRGAVNLMQQKNITTGFQLNAAQNLYLLYFLVLYQNTEEEKNDQRITHNAINQVMETTEALAPTE